MFYYNGVNLTHNRRNPQLIYQEKSTSAKGLAVLRPDGYVSVEAESYAPGDLDNPTVSVKNPAAL